MATAQSWRRAGRRQLKCKLEFGWQIGRRGQKGAGFTIRIHKLDPAASSLPENRSFQKGNGRAKQRARALGVKYTVLIALIRFGGQEKDAIFEWYLPACVAFEKSLQSSLVKASGLKKVKSRSGFSEHTNFWILNKEYFDYLQFHIKQTCVLKMSIA